MPPTHQTSLPNFFHSHSFAGLYVESTWVEILMIKTLFFSQAYNRVGVVQIMKITMWGVAAVWRVDWVENGADGEARKMSTTWNLSAIYSFPIYTKNEIFPPARHHFAWFAISFL